MKGRGAGNGSDCSVASCGRDIREGSGHCLELGPQALLIFDGPLQTDPGLISGIGESELIFTYKKKREKKHKQV